MCFGLKRYVEIRSFHLSMIFLCYGIFYLASLDLGVSQRNIGLKNVCDLVFSDEFTLSNEQHNMLVSFINIRLSN